MMDISGQGIVEPKGILGLEINGIEEGAIIVVPVDQLLCIVGQEYLVP